MGAGPGATPVPNEALLSINIRDKQLHDVYRLNVTTGELTLDT